ncbi:DASS family sodium-coupled anion symporter [Bacillus sp. FSL W8-0445]|jgi:sodium-dependent dicarboxylate transporter 2/3/5|uniref:Sodium-dependent dicarboxylate transporter SdcS n=4 Tax=Bacillus licheniformis TaxID=1402 RepID=Q65NC0_BACLD|nr:MULTISPECIES: DASS family sodium-coupled anion symporter [Bacillus]MDP4081823.1 DASS family sodium-coupled anion symporter [Bacillota bacterium]AAU22087.1 Sodium/sulphate symporter [Bacillus licheniformis DSM 13 = ATCC 14580]AAU39444.1 sodium-dependent dicarboxylate transporter SdcS [Bacillus licheniformis DSM 13 = ATCC 14580]ACT83405.1 Na+-dicarboxylate transporter [Bacillus licheniformis]AOP13492.1 Sodium-dependent dicarboxylate transporter SdcS [Bacillus licheniformis]
MKSSVVSAWDMLWRSHREAKRLLLFAMPVRAGKDAGLKINSEQTMKEEKPPSYKTPQKIGLLLGPALFFAVLLFFFPEGLSYEGRMVLATTLWVAVWWITEAVPIPAASLLPIVLLPLTGALEGAAVTSSYGDPIVFLFLGGFLIALAMERWNLHKRIALNIISVVGTSTSRIVLGFMAATGFLSMWVSNTAAVMMMLPIGTAIIHQVSAVIKSERKDLAAEEAKFSKALIFSIGYAGTIGGLGTLIGTPPNIILAANIKKLYGVEVSFGGWMAFAVPVVVILLVAVWLYLTKVAHPIKMKELPGGKELILEEKRKLGKMSFEETMVLLVFGFAAFMWVTRTFLWDDKIPGIDDTMIAIFAASLLFLIPSLNKGGRVLDWSVSKDLPWGILLLFGGGLALATGFKETGLAEWIGGRLTVLDGFNFVVIVIISTALVLFLTEITSNTATATMILPVLASLALALNVHPYALMVPAAMAANCAFMLPVGTPPNAIIFASGKLKISEMVRTGFVINIFTLILIVGAVFYILPHLWGVDLTVFPDNLKSN